MKRIIGAAVALLAFTLSPVGVQASPTPDATMIGSAVSDPGRTKWSNFGVQVVQGHAGFASLNFGGQIAGCQCGGGGGGLVAEGLIDVNVPTGDVRGAGALDSGLRFAIAVHDGAGHIELMARSDNPSYSVRIILTQTSAGLFPGVPAVVVTGSGSDGFTAYTLRVADGTGAFDWANANQSFTGTVSGVDGLTLSGDRIAAVNFHGNASISSTAGPSFQVNFTGTATAGNPGDLTWGYVVVGCQCGGGANFQFGTITITVPPK